MSHSNHTNEEKNDFNTISEMPWYRPWILVAFLALVIFMLVRGCKETFKYETLTVTQEGTDANAHNEHGVATTNDTHASETATVPIDTMKVVKDSL